MNEREKISEINADYDIGLHRCGFIDVDVDMSIVMPLYRAGNIAWLPLESLCRQKQINFRWELLIAEEQEGAFGWPKIKEYFGRLNKVGCARIIYYSLPKWIPLSQKYHLLTRQMHPSSKIFTTQAGDNYSHPMRLKLTHLYLIKRDYDMWHQAYGLFYDIPTGQMIGFNYYRNPERPVCMTAAYKAEYVRNLPFEFKKSGLDSWLYYNILKASGKKELKTWTSGNRYWDKGVNTQGQNTISVKRARHFKKPKNKLFGPTSIKIEEVVPHPIAQRLKNMRSLKRAKKIRSFKAWKINVKNGIKRRLKWIIDTKKH